MAVALDLDGYLGKGSLRQAWGACRIWCRGSLEEEVDAVAGAFGVAVDLTQTHADIGDYVQAMAGLSLAFQALLTNYQIGEGPTRWSAFNFGEKPSPFDESRGEYRDPGLKRFEKLENFMLITQDTLLAISLGIDYASMARFHILTPQVRTYGNGDKRYYIGKDLEEVTSDHYDRARHFVIESGLRAAKADSLQAMEKKRWEANRRPKKLLPHRFWTGPVDPEDRSVTVFDVL